MFAAYEAIWSHQSQPLWVVTAASGGRRGGLIATFVAPVSIVRAMPRVLVSLSVRHHTTELVRHSSAFALHLLGEAEIDWVWQFGLASGRGRDKVRGLATRTGSTGTPILTSAPAYLECRVETSMETGDRTTFLAAVIDAAAAPDLNPLTLARLRDLAPPEKLARMDELYERDAAADAQLIALFRA